jgi:hypothetical protein
VTRHPFASHERRDDLEGLAEATHSVIECEPKGGVVGLVPPSTEAEHQSATRNLLNCGRLLRQDRGRVERSARNQWSNLDLRSNGGDRCERRPALVRSTFWTTVVTVEKVVTHPERVEASLFCRHRDRSQFWPADDSLNLRELNANSKWLSTHSVTL